MVLREYIGHIAAVLLAKLIWRLGHQLKRFKFEPIEHNVIFQKLGVQVKLKLLVGPEEVD